MRGIASVASCQVVVWLRAGAFVGRRIAHGGSELNGGGAAAQYREACRLGPTA